MKLVRYLIISVVGLSVASCSDLESMNNDPNNPTEVPSNMIMEGAEKWAVDNVYSAHFSCMQCLLYSQQWARRNHTEEDRYRIPDSQNNDMFNYLYRGMANFERVISLNTDETTKETSAIYGANCNQIAAAMIMQVWLMNVITDTWGSVPYSEIGKMESDDVIYCKYDDQKDIYAMMISRLDSAVAMIDETKEAFVAGDVIYGGDAKKWRKFGNSLKCRLAVHLSKVDANWRNYITEALASGVMEGNDDAAKFRYSTSGSDYCMLYETFFNDERNDYVITRPLVDLMKGQCDTLNNKTHPWEGVVDPRLQIYTTPNADGVYQGIPYGAPTGVQDKLAATSPNWYNAPPLCLRADYAVPLMTYAELKFILCEYNDYSEADYREGVEASIRYWYDLDGSSISDSEIDAYVDAVSQNVNAEACAIQKYIDLFTNGTEAWTEIRRTGYPTQLLRPGDITCIYNGNTILFTTLTDTKGDIIARVKYPTNESSLNGKNFADAVEKLTDGTNNCYSKMYWDVD